MEARRLRKDDAVTVQPDGRIAKILSMRKESGVQYAFILMRDTHARLKVPLKFCKLAHIEPDERPRELNREWAFRAVNKETDEIVHEPKWRTTKALAVKDRNSLKYLFNRAVQLQIIERTERICEVGDGQFRVSRFT